MCGLVTIYKKRGGEFGQEEEAYFLDLGREMVSTLRYRGPDESSVVRFGNTIMGHARLSIIDLSTGSQPIFNEDKTVAVLLNGEIYNFIELRETLIGKGHIFRTNTDTEAIVHLYEEHGEEVFSHLNGMFAITIYDKKKNLLLAARDRMGQKPIVYWDSPDMFVVASELKTILKYQKVERELDLSALSLYLNCMYVPAPHSILKGIKKLKPAHYMRIKDGAISMKQFWHPSSQIQWDWKESDISESFIELFKDAVKARTIADVPIGVFLSGGIDSSAVTAFMAKACSGPIKTFSVGFSDEVDERPFARLVSDRYRTEHYEIFIESKVEDILEHVMQYFDEPFGDSSAIPTYLVAKEARKFVKVILTGDGGDELFAGYGSYIDQKYLLKGRVLSFLTKKLNQLSIKLFKHGFLKYITTSKRSKLALSHWSWVRTVFEQQEIDKLLQNSGGDFLDFYRNNHWLLIPNKDPLSVAYSHDFNYYLPDDLLKKVDMASMLASLECRSPFLDYRLVEFALKIPPRLKVKNDNLKYILKTSLEDHLPETILNRPKTGFGAPVGSWLRKQLKPMVNDMLSGGCRIEAIFSKEDISNIKRNVYTHNEQSDYRTDFQLWLLFVLEIWMRKYM